MIAQAGGDQLQHLPLAFGQLGHHLGGILLVGAGEGHDAAGNRGAVDRLAGWHRQQGPKEHRLRRRLYVEGDALLGGTFELVELMVQAHPRPSWSTSSGSPPAQLIPKGVMSASEAEEGSAVSNDEYSRAGRQTSGWAVGFILFAAIMMIMVGVFQALQGLIAIFENEFYVATRNYLFQFDATTWGWIHLVIGLLVAFAGYGLLSGRTWARVAAITLAVLSAIANFLFIPYCPFWALLIITLDVFVIWAVAAHGGELRKDQA